MQDDALDYSKATLDWQQSTQQTSYDIPAQETSSVHNDLDNVDKRSHSDSHKALAETTNVTREGNDEGEVQIIWYTPHAHETDVASSGHSLSPKRTNTHVYAHKPHFQTTQRSGTSEIEEQSPRIVCVQTGERASASTVTGASQTHPKVDVQNSWRTNRADNIWASPRLKRLVRQALEQEKGSLTSHNNHEAVEVAQSERQISTRGVIQRARPYDTQILPGKSYRYIERLTRRVVERVIRANQEDGQPAELHPRPQRNVRMENQRTLRPEGQGEACTSLPDHDHTMSRDAEYIQVPKTTTTYVDGGSLTQHKSDVQQTTPSDDTENARGEELDRLTSQVIEHWRRTVRKIEAHSHTQSRHRFNFATENSEPGIAMHFSQQRPHRAATNRESASHGRVLENRHNHEREASGPFSLPVDQKLSHSKNCFQPHEQYHHSSHLAKASFPATLVQRTYRNHVSKVPVPEFVQEMQHTFPPSHIHPFFLAQRPSGDLQTQETHLAETNTCVTSTQQRHGICHPDQQYALGAHAQQHRELSTRPHHPTGMIVAQPSQHIHAQREHEHICCPNTCAEDRPSNFNNVSQGRTIDESGGFGTGVGQVELNRESGLSMKTCPLCSKMFSTVRH